MDSLFVQNLRYKLQKRVRRLNSVDKNLFLQSLRHFWSFIDSNPTLHGVTDLLRLNHRDIEAHLADAGSGQFPEASSEEELAALGFFALRQLAGETELGILLHTARRIGHVQDFTESLELLRDALLEPLYEYIDEHLDDQRAMLALLLRYKHRTEWFRRDDLLESFRSNTRRGEGILALDLYAYLFDQGVDFVIEPSSVTGEVDLLSAQDTEDPVVLDAKVFDGGSRGKSYLCTGFNQIYTYTQQYNEPFGYLVIFKICASDLSFSTPELSDNFAVVHHNYKTIFLLTIDIADHDQPVSKRGSLRTTTITEDELVVPICASDSPTTDDRGSTP